MEKECLSYEEYLERVRGGILTDSGNCPVTLLLLMIQGKWKGRILYQFCIHDKIRFGELKKALPQRPAGFGTGWTGSAGAVQRNSAACGILFYRDGQGPSARVLLHDGMGLQT